MINDSFYIIGFIYLVLESINVTQNIIGYKNKNSFIIEQKSNLQQLEEDNKKIINTIPKKNYLKKTIGLLLFLWAIIGYASNSPEKLWFFINFLSTILFYIFFYISVLFTFIKTAYSHKNKFSVNITFFSITTSFMEITSVIIILYKHYLNT